MRGGALQVGRGDRQSIAADQATGLHLLPCRPATARSVSWRWSTPADLTLNRRLSNKRSRLLARERRTVAEKAVEARQDQPDAGAVPRPALAKIPGVTVAQGSGVDWAPTGPGSRRRKERVRRVARLLKVRKPMKRL